jgi:hypothetical protein
MSLDIYIDGSYHLKSQARLCDSKGMELHHVISFPAVFVLPSAAEPTIFQLSCTTADGRKVSADSFLA